MPGLETIARISPVAGSIATTLPTLFRISSWPYCWRAASIVVTMSFPGTASLSIAPSM